MLTVPAGQYPVATHAPRHFWRSGGLPWLAILAIFLLAGCNPNQSISLPGVPGRYKKTVRPHLRSLPLLTGSDGSQTGVASFLGNFTTISEPPPTYFALQRQPDCSLTSIVFKASLTSTGTITPTILTSTPHYERVLHQLASLTTTPDVFTKGCAQSALGIGSRTGLLAGTNLLVTGTVNGNLVTMPFGAPPSNAPLTYTLDMSVTTATAFATADLNGDGTADLVLVNGNVPPTSFLSVLLGNKDGTFQTPVEYPTSGNYSAAAVIDDVNGDGKLDLVSVSADQQFSVLLGKGDGTFAAAQNFAAPVLPNQTSATSTPIINLITADLRGVGTKDIIGSNGLILFGNGDGTFTPAPAAAFPYVAGVTGEGPNLASGDINNDGKLDLVLSTGASVSTWLGKGDGTFTAGGSYSPILDTGYVTISDLDGDGNADIYIGLANGGAFSGDDFDYSEAYVLMGHGDGTFAGAPMIPGSYTGSNLGDVNGDGLPDLITNVYDQYSNPKPGFTVQLGTVTGAFNPVSTITAPASFSLGGKTVTGANTVGTSTFTVSDINGDGKSDLVFVQTAPNVNNSSGSPSPISFTALSNGDGTFATPVAALIPQIAPAANYDESLTVASVMAGAFTASGHKDLVLTFTDIIGGTGVSNPYTGGFAVLPGNGDGTFKAPVVTTTSSNATTQLYGAPLLILSTTDLNGDGKGDILAASPSGVTQGNATSQLALYLGNGDGTFQAPAAIATAANPELIFGSACTVTDINKDGKLDLVCLGETTASQAELAISLGNGDGTFATPTILNVSGGDAIRNSGIGVADFDGDGNVDIALLDSEDLSGIFYGKGDGTFTSVPSNGYSYAKDLVNIAVGGPTLATDLNHDGKPDLLVGNAVLLNIYGSAPVMTPQASSTTVLTASAATVAAGINVTFTATITGASGSSGTPTGTATFLDGTTSLGTGTLNASGVATFSTTKLATAAHSITAQYSGDSNFAASTSAAVTVTVTASVPASFTFSASPASLSITAGQAGTTTLTVTPAGGFAQAVSFACSGLPSEASCSFSPATVTPATTAVTSVLTVTTTAAHVTEKTAAARSGFAGLLALVSMLLFGIPARRGAAQWGRVFALSVACILAGALMGCGGGSSSSGGGAGGTASDPGTPAGTSTVTVTATAGALSQTVTLQVTVP